jgi:signal transduction histidine kinase
MAAVASPPAARYAIPVIACLVALGITIALSPHLQNVIFIFFWPAVFVSAWFAGRGASWTATILSVLLVNHFFIEPVGSTIPESPESLIALAFFLVLGGTVGEVTARFRIADRELATAAKEANERAEQLQEQAIELEAQTEEAQSLTEELEATNSELQDAVQIAQQARAEAEQANQAKTDFLATMSHELRTPLNAIAGHAELLEVGIHGPVTQKQRDALQRIQRSQRHLLGLINDVLNFAKLAAGKVEFSITEVPLRAALQRLEDLVTLHLQEKQLQLIRANDVDGHVVRADPDKLQQILLNVMSNAIKFTPAGGRLTLSCTATDATVSVALADTGIGIPADQQAQIFEPFVQLGRGLTTAHSGTGLGLAISRDLARAMGGDIGVTSELGRGSTFTVTLPRG